MILDKLLEPGVLALLIPVLAIVGWIVATILKHRERMAMIANGMNPAVSGEPDKQQEDTPKQPLP